MRAGTSSGQATVYCVWVCAGGPRVRSQTQAPMRDPPEKPPPHQALEVEPDDRALQGAAQVRQNYSSSWLVCVALSLCRDPAEIQSMVSSLLHKKWALAPRRLSEQVM